MWHYHRLSYVFIIALLLPLKNATKWRAKKGENLFSEWPTLRINRIFSFTLFYYRLNIFVKIFEKRIFRKWGNLLIPEERGFMHRWHQAHQLNVLGEISNPNPSGYRENYNLLRICIKLITIWAFLRYGTGYKVSANSANLEVSYTQKQELIFLLVFNDTSVLQSVT